jgi:hypothetical protein
MTRTNAYVMTVELVNGKANDEVLNLVKMLVRLENKYKGTKKYVKLQGRGPRKVNGKKYFQSLPLQYATSADVYVYQRY